MVWGANCTGIVDDTRVLEKNVKEDILIIPDFCEGLVSDEEWATVNSLIKVRADNIASVRQAGNALNGKQITPTAPGLTIKYLLTGLVRCGHCGRAMTPSSSPTYVNKTGESKRYVSYVCPGYLARICPNIRRVPEDWLRQVVVGKVRERVLPEANRCKGSPGIIDEGDLMGTPWFAPLRDEIRRELEQLSAGIKDQRPVLEQEMHDLVENEKGWALSLAKADLNSSIRAAIEVEWEKALTRTTEIEGILAEAAGHKDHVDQILDPSVIVKHLQRLHDVLAAHNPTRGNLELSSHIDRIDCFFDGKVVMRTCMLGALAEATCIVAARVTPDRDNVQWDGTIKSKPRRRAKLRVDPLAPNGNELKAAAHFAADPARFAHLPDQWFWQDIFHIPAKTCWASDHASEVARLKATLTIVEIAERYSKSPPTIRAALRLAKEADPSLSALPRKRPRRRWTVDHAAEVAQLKQQGMTTKDIAERLGKSDTTIREALSNSQQTHTDLTKDIPNAADKNRPTEMDSRNG